MNYKKIIIDACLEMCQKGLTIETWGNISIKGPDTNLIYITPSGMPYPALTEDDIVVLNQDGSIHEGNRVPSVESYMHVLIYQKRPEINVILHTHPIDSTVFAVLRKPIPVFTDEMAQTFGEQIEVSEYALPGSVELANNVAQALGNNMAVLIANHGAVCVGKTVKEAFKTCTVLESCAQIYYKALSIGNPVVLEESDIQWMRDFALNQYGKGNQ